MAHENKSTSTEQSADIENTITASLDKQSVHGIKNALGADTSAAVSFLHRLGGESFTFQTFDDNKNRGDRGLARVLNGSLEEHKATLIDLNQRGAGIFVTVNETDLKGRKNSNIIRARAVWQEDDAGDPNTPAPDLMPHMVIESSPDKYHRYWLTSTDDFDDWSAVQLTMVERFGSDPNAKDLPRVLRLPGFLHQKYPDNPWLVSIVNIDHDAPPYDWEDIKAAIPPCTIKFRRAKDDDYGFDNPVFDNPPDFTKLGSAFQLDNNHALGRPDDIYSYADYLLSTWNGLSAETKDAELEKITDILPVEYYEGEKWLPAMGAYFRSGTPNAKKLFIKLSRRSSKPSHKELTGSEIAKRFESMGSYKGKPATMRCILLAANDVAYHLPGDESVDLVRENNVIVPGNVSPGAYVGKEVNPRPHTLAPNFDWPNPTPLPDEMPDVPKLKPKLMPPSVRGYAYDISNRTQSPLEFTSVSTIAMLGSLIGTQLGVRPKSKDNWTVVPNLWAVIVGEPSTYKSPAMSGSMKPLKRLEHEAREQHKSDLIKWQVQDSINKAQNKANEKQMTSLMGQLAKEATPAKQQALQAQIDGLANAMVPQGDAPQARRHLVNDATVEKLGELLNQNPNGLMVERDELSGLLRVFEDERKSDRGFYLEAWNGTGSHTYDRIGRGTIPIEHACVSIVGGIQPDLLRRHLSHSRDADGMVQRFQLAVWPDKSTNWKLVDKYPDKQVKDAMCALCERLANLDTNLLGQQDEFDRIPYVRFSDEAQPVFDDWYTKLMLRTRNMDGNLPMSAHLGKYPSLIASLALVFHLADEVPDDYAVSKTWVSNGIGLDSLNRAIAWGDFLEQHAYRVHAQQINPALMSAFALLKKIRSGTVKNSFKLRDVYRNGWSDLTDKKAVLAAVMVLQEFDYIHTLKTRMEGRDVYQNHVNPKSM